MLTSVTSKTRVICEPMYLNKRKCAFALLPKETRDLRVPFLDWALRYRPIARRASHAFGTRASTATLLLHRTTILTGRLLLLDLPRLLQTGVLRRLQ